MAEPGTHDAKAAAAVAADADPVEVADSPARARLALALDVDDLVEAVRLARTLRPYFGVAKVGLELYSAAGPDAIEALVEQGFDVFVDLKLFDIPTTVERAARVIGALGARYLTLHARDDAPMLRAGVEGFRDGAAAAGLDPPTALAVTVLTSDKGAPPHVMPRRAALAAETGCGGVVCAAADLRLARQIAPRLLRVTPGIRPTAAASHDQARPATPAEAIREGADLLVVGRAVTRAEDPEAAAAAIVAEVEASLAS
jgi:orotidine-5'-phosphate decarboxylase